MFRVVRHRWELEARQHLRLWAPGCSPVAEPQGEPQEQVWQKMTMTIVPVVRMVRVSVQLQVRAHSQVECAAVACALV